MKNHRFYSLLAAVAALAIASLACYFGQPSQPPTAVTPPTTVPVIIQPTPVVVQPTEVQPTEPVVTEEANTDSDVDPAFKALLEEYRNKGYVSSTEGDFYTLDPFKEESADVSSYYWWPYDLTASDLVFKGHLSWSTANSTNAISGCGVIFGLQENDDHYGVFLDRTRIAFFMTRGSYPYEIGKTSGSGRLNFGNPAEADMVLSVKGKTAYVSVDGADPTTYTLSQDQTTQGTFALTLWSGSTVGYGTRCEMTDMILFIPK